MTVEDCNKAIALKSNYAEAYNNRGEAHRESGEFDAALTDLNKAIQLKANNASAHFNRGLVYYQKGVYEESIKDYSMMIKQNPKFAPAHYFRGLARLHLKEWEKAKADLILSRTWGVILLIHSVTTTKMLKTLRRNITLNSPQTSWRCQLPTSIAVKQKHPP